MFSEPKTKGYINAKGNWKIAKDFEGTKWVLQLNFEKDDISKDGFLMEFDLYFEREKLILWYFVGDPDSGERLLFEKE
ncbi:MAG: hypothetical protein M0D53_10535 [Flavobacterium sp. JAD_PAG50586_2]|nr:MAG: hypothetical protein M0D53_10535 [Flavobacterium sp. JAD_PAG50586_2]